MPAEACILDGYVDEPACLGVPPYLSPYIRTVAGALTMYKYRVRYLTIDQLRKDPQSINDAGSCGFAGHDCGGHCSGKIPRRHSCHHE